jgi:hypothetical protein
MHNSKAAEILRTFSQDELKRFRSFVASPFHNTNKNVVKLLELSRKYAPEFKAPFLAKENLFKKLYPGKKYSDIVMRILISDLMRLCEEYLAYNRFINEPMDEKILLLKEYNNRGLVPLFNTSLKRSELKLEKSGVSSSTFFLDRMFIEREKIDHNINVDRQKINGDLLLKNGEYLISFFLLGLMNTAHDINVHKDLYNMQYELNLTEKFLENFNIENFIGTLKKSKYEYTDVIEIYYLMFKANLNIEDEGSYNLFKKRFYDNIAIFNNEEKYELYLKLESIVIQKIERGNTEMYHELFDIYKNLIKSGLYRSPDTLFMRIEMFRNILFTGLTIKEYDWTEKFVNSYVDELSPEFRDNMRNQALAYIYFDKKQYEEALKYIKKINFDIIVQKADVKIMMLKLYYELSLFDSAYSLCDTFSKFIHKNKNVSELFKVRYIEFLKIYRKLINKKSGVSEEPPGDIEFELQNSKHILSRKWFCEKIAEFDSH